MKAVLRTGLLGTTLSFVSDYVSDPKFVAESPKNAKEVHVKINAAAINPVDYKLPKAIGGSRVSSDFSGTIEEVGSEVTSGLKVGDEVFGWCKGSLAEMAIASESRVTKVPNGWTATECAAIPIAYGSALQCLVAGKLVSVPGENDADTATANKDKSILVIGASGGCGMAGLQLCKALGVGRIVAICSSRNVELVKELGATEVVDYTKESEMKTFFDDNKGKFDCVYDVATNSGGGEDYWKMSLEMLKKDDGGKVCGEYVALNGPASKWIRAFMGKQKEHETIIMLDPKSADLELIVSLLDKIKAKPRVNVMPFSEQGVTDGFKLLKSRRAKGKIVFDFHA